MCPQRATHCLPSQSPTPAPTFPDLDMMLAEAESKIKRLPNALRTPHFSVLVSVVVPKVPAVERAQQILAGFRINRPGCR